MLRTGFLAFVFCLITAQLCSTSCSAGIAGGFSFTFGTKINRIGVTANVFNEDRIIANAGFRLFYCFNNLGPEGGRWETNLYFGAGYAYGERRREIDWLERYKHDPTTNHSQYRSSAAIAYLIYLDEAGTSQNTGQIGLQHQSLRLIAENDIFAGSGADKFRTGAFLFAYRHEDTEFAISNILWTSNPKAKGYERRSDTDYPARFGYFDAPACPHLGCSHGILTVQVSQLLPYGQIARLRAGIDSERIRNFVQNKLIHDMPFIPTKWVGHKNPHVPMVTKSGEAYLFEEGQEIKPASLFFTFGWNEGVFY